MVFCMWVRKPNSIMTGFIDAEQDQADREGGEKEEVYLLH